jgi:DNA-binding transcriptional LysR family regulator
MRVFERVASARSFSGAARELGISQATASKHVQTLEGWLGARLLHRTTRRVELTEAGESFYVQCSRILEEMEAVRSSTKPAAAVRGSMRIAAPVVFGSIRLGPLLAAFLHRHPELSLNIELSNRSVDLIEEGYDLAIRTSPVAGPGLIAWPLMPINYVLCAAPGYLASHGRPDTPAELTGHHCITGTDSQASNWQFDGPDGVTEIPIYTRLQVNNAMLRCDAARAGAGVLMCADYLVEGDFDGGRLVRLLPEYKPTGSTLHAVSPIYRAASPRVRSLVSHLTASLGEPD